MPIPTIDEMIDLAKGAGDILRSAYGKTHQIDRKGRIDLVTEVDHRSEAYLVAAIRQRHPGQRINTEESGVLSGAERFTWYIDPLDGTTNYAHHLPIFSVSIAFAEEGALLRGVIYDPMRDECFSAERGGGAWLNGAPLHVSDTPDLLHSLLTTGFPYDMQIIETNLANFTHFSKLTQGVRRLGSAAVDLCYVAAGRLDGYWEISLQPYDMAAGALIVEEAGGKVTSVTGDANYMRPPFSVLAANPRLHALMLAEFQKNLS